MVSRCACQRQLKPPGGITRSNVGVVENWWTCSCCILPNSGPRRRILGLGKRGAASKIVARPRRGKTCSTLGQSGGIWAGASPGWGSPASQMQGVAGCPTSQGAGGQPHPPPHTHTHLPHREKEPGAHCWPTVMAVVPPTTAGAGGLPHALPTTSMSASTSMSTPTSTSRSRCGRGAGGLRRKDRARPGVHRARVAKRVVGPLSRLWCHRPPQVPGSCPTRCPPHQCPRPHRCPRPIQRCHRCRALRR